MCCLSLVQCLRTLQSHTTGGVWCSEFDGQIVVSGSTDRTLRVSGAHVCSCIAVCCSSMGTGLKEEGESGFGEWALVMLVLPSTCVSMECQLW